MIKGLIFYENPIARFYINLLITYNYNLEKLIYLNKKTFLPNSLMLRAQFNKNNFWALNFLKNKSIGYLLSQIEEYFNFPANFIKNSYNFKLLNELSCNTVFANTNDVNNELVAGIIKDSGNIDFLISSKHILKKNILTLRNNFLHIHPGYLPYIRGADGSLWGPYIRKKVGVSCFYLTKQIDKGKIISRLELDIPKFKLPRVKEYNLKDMYRLWFSFFDPLLRCYMLRKILNNNYESFNKDSIDYSEEKYFTFMSDNIKSLLFNEIFSK